MCTCKDSRPLEFSELIHVHTSGLLQSISHTVRCSSHPLTDLGVKFGQQLWVQVVHLLQVFQQSWRDKEEEGRERGGMEEKRGGEECDDKKEEEEKSRGNQGKRWRRKELGRKKEDKEEHRGGGTNLDHL